jgi:hypothetical protein
MSGYGSFASDTQVPEYTDINIRETTYSCQF